jgi:hypothetical protein
MEYIRWGALQGLLRQDPHQARVACGALGLCGVGAEPVSDYVNWTKHVFVGRTSEPPLRWKRMRRVFHELSGRVVSLGDDASREMSHRRIEARLLRAAIVPVTLSVLVALRSANLPGAWPWLLAVGAFVAMVGAYIYRECTVADTIGYFAHRL